MDSKVYIAIIEGLADADGQHKWCFPYVPDYAAADDQYSSGLAEVPSGVGSTWNIASSEMSVGTFRLVFRDAVGPVVWLRTRARPVTELDGAITTSTDPISIKSTPAGVGISIGGPTLYINRESFDVTGISTRALTVTRGYAGSDAAAHVDGSDVYISAPPALVGRKVEVYEVDRTGSSSGAETLILAGYVSSEPASGLDVVTISVRERWDSVAELNPDPQLVSYHLMEGTNWDPGTFDPPLRTAPVSASALSSGMYFWLPGVPAVYEATSDGSIIGRPVWGEPITPGTGLDHGLCYEILYSNIDDSYPPFGSIPNGEAFAASDHPCEIALNILLSLDGANKDSGETNYDRGTHIGGSNGLFPRYALGIPVGRVDVAEFQRVQDTELANVRASEYWLGGKEPENARAALNRLFRPFGYAIGTTRAKWTLLRLRDTYPGGSTNTIDGNDVVDAKNIQHTTIGRAIDRIILKTDPGPDKDGDSLVIIEDVNSRNFYPPHVGAVEKHSTPYRHDDLVVNTVFRYLVANRIERLSSRIAVASVTVSAQSLAIDIGDDVVLTDQAVRLPTTGARMTGAESVSGQVIGANVDWKKRTLSLKIAIGATANLCRFGPSAKVLGYDPLLNIVTVEAHEFTRSGENTDAQRFSVGDVCRLIDSHLEIRGFSSNGTITALTSTTELDFSGDTFSVTPFAGNYIVFADWDAVQASQKTSYGYAATGGAAGSPASLGSGADDPYVYGA